MWDTHPRDLVRTPFRPSKLLLIHMLWFTSSVGLWVGMSLFLVAHAFATLFPGIAGIDSSNDRTSPLAFPVILTYTGSFAVWSSWIWIRSLRRSLASFRHANNVGNSGGSDDPGHYLAPFKSATRWAFGTPPIYIGLAVLGFFFFPMS